MLVRVEYVSFEIPPKPRALAPTVVHRFMSLLKQMGTSMNGVRALPRVWRGKDLDMIVFGRDERLEWARKTGMFLARARTALGGASSGGAAQSRAPRPRTSSS